jgi:predicted acetyltransferase
MAKYAIYKNPIDVSKIQLIPATLNDYAVVQNMGRFYAYDLSEYFGNEPGWEMPENGLYECNDFKKYWETEHAFPFLVRYDNELAGFVIIDKKGSDATMDFNIAQFFILRKFKRRSLGRAVARQCFDKFCGTWEVMVMPGNEGAYHFWRSVIKAYTANNFTEYTREIAHLGSGSKDLFKFNNKEHAD